MNLSTAPKSYSGSLLIASPYVADSRYAQRVVFLLYHSAEGALGVHLDGTLRQTLSGFRELLAGEEWPSDETLQDWQLNLVAWAPGQLESEMNYGLWLTQPATSEQFTEVGADLWRRMVCRVGRSVLRDALGIRDFPADARNN